MPVADVLKQAVLPLIGNTKDEYGPGEFLPTSYLCELHIRAYGE
jgi:hypothetical protein